MLMLTSVLSGCVTIQGERFTKIENPPTGMSVVYFYRVNKLLTNSTTPAIRDNNKVVLSGLPSGAYWKYYLAPGKHVFEPKRFGLFKKVTATVDIKEPGEVHFVELDVSIGYIGLTPQDREVALSKISDCFEVTAK